MLLCGNNAPVLQRAVDWTPATPTGPPPAASLIETLIDSIRASKLSIPTRLARVQGRQKRISTRIDFLNKRMKSTHDIAARTDPRMTSYKLEEYPHPAWEYEMTSAMPFDQLKSSEEEALEFETLVNLWRKKWRFREKALEAEIEWAATGDTNILFEACRFAREEGYCLGAQPSTTAEAWRILGEVEEIRNVSKREGASGQSRAQGRNQGFPKNRLGIWWLWPRRPRYASYNVPHSKKTEMICNVSHFGKGVEEGRSNLCWPLHETPSYKEGTAVCRMKVTCGAQWPDAMSESRVRRLRAKRQYLLSRIRSLNARSMAQAREKYPGLDNELVLELIGMLLAEPTFTNPITSLNIEALEYELSHYETLFHFCRPHILFIEKQWEADCLNETAGGSEHSASLHKACAFALENGLAKGKVPATDEEAYEIIRAVRRNLGQFMAAVFRYMTASGATMNIFGRDWYKYPYPPGSNR
ncbi:hypothetical protein BJ508DRAFT_313562 [Ascobolus immersus RN42]|uniref:Uncharacterized protein n=1 Tax=Ascobolus immersus RN42 TaxID=1160509 RepID=A0A3N4HIB1_ASCIM|nr:hypothetical protein BJ508DRAFT_313562 [Ascobolus immersus RN42]